MDTPLDRMALWRRTLSQQNDSFDGAREILRQSFLGFRLRVADLVSTIGSELPHLTVHDITHIDSLWRVAEEIIGENYPINAAEAYVLGGAFLLHDAAHVLAAYPGRLDAIRQTVQWQDFVAQRMNGVNPEANSTDEKLVIFQVLRQLHAEQAHRLPYMSWKVDTSGGDLYLIENYELREYYGDLIGKIAASHHWDPSKVVAEFASRRVPSPPCLVPADWQVDALKVAMLLRCADAAHLDAQRAPWFLFALRQPEGISSEHWRFQAKFGQPTLAPEGKLLLSSGAPFSSNERNAWWLALDTARMVDRELRSAHEILREEGRPVFAAGGVVGVESAVAFSKVVPVSGWEPIDVGPKIGSVPSVIASLGGTALYGEDYSVPLRELLQNGLDAVSALRELGGIGSQEGSIHVAVRSLGGKDWLLEVTDTGIGMSRYVITNVLLDFGTSLWKSDAMREELPGLARSGFQPIGKFGIGFFSVFMLSTEVTVTTRRYEQAQDRTSLHWQLRFEGGLGSRPALLSPDRAQILQRPGTRVSVKLSESMLDEVLESVQKDSYSHLFAGLWDIFPKPVPEIDRRDKLLALLVGKICPSSLVNITTQVDTGTKYLAVGANDWTSISDELLLNRVRGNGKKLFPLKSADGALLGRIAPASAEMTAQLTYQGVACGELSGLEGVVLARSNNSDAQRVKAAPAGQLGDWQSWARCVLSGSPSLTLEQKVRLHVLLPELDFAVWTIGKNITKLEEVLGIAGMSDEVILLDGTVEHEDSDSVGSDSFRNSFQLAQGVVCYPSSLVLSGGWTVPFGGVRRRGPEAYPWFLGVEPVPYLARFEAGLHRLWGEFDSEELDEYAIGSVDGVEILRSATRYFKTS